jgi:hypothetical protein
MITKPQRSYTFQTNDFALSEEGIHLLRNNYNYRTVSFLVITHMEIKRKKDMKNWLFILSLGVALLAFVGYDVNKICSIYNDPGTYEIYIERLLIPFFPLVLGAYSVTIALRNSIVLTFESETKKYHLTLRALSKDNVLDEFTKELRLNYPGLSVIQHS